jgi:hypothetical protein
MEDAVAVLVLVLRDELGHGPAGVQEALTELRVRQANGHGLSREVVALGLCHCAEAVVLEEDAARPVDEAHEGDRVDDDHLRAVLGSHLSREVEEGLHDRQHLLLGEVVEGQMVLVLLELVILAVRALVAVAGVADLLVGLEELLVLPALLEEGVVKDPLRRDLGGLKDGSNVLGGLLLHEARAAAGLGLGGGHGDLGCWWCEGYL